MTEPIPLKWLRDGKLVAEDFSFSINSPNPDCHWTYARLADVQGSKQTAFIVKSSIGTNFLIVVWNKTGGMDASGTKSFVDEVINESMPKDSRVDDAKIEQSALPMKDSSKLTSTIHLPNEASVYAHGYVVSSNQTYMFLNYSADKAESPQFNHFVRSFALLSPPKSKSRLGFCVFAGIVVLGWVIPIWISVKAKPLADKPYHWGTYVGIITGFIGIMFSLYTYSLFTPYSSADVYGKGCGVALSLCAILCCIGILRRRRFGVMMFVVTYLMFMMVIPFLHAMRNEPANSQQQGQTVPMLMLIVITIVYFKKRWRLMGSPKPIDALRMSPDEKI